MPRIATRPKSKVYKPKQKTYPISQLEEVILLILYGTELYGLEICRAIEEVSGIVLVKPNSLYPTLKAMKKTGLVSERYGTSPEDKGKAGIRIYYRLTELGVQTITDVRTFRSRLQSWKKERSEEAQEPSPGAIEPGLTRLF